MLVYQRVMAINCPTLSIIMTTPSLKKSWMKPQSDVCRPLAPAGAPPDSVTLLRRLFGPVLLSALQCPAPQHRPVCCSQPRLKPKFQHASTGKSTPSKMVPAKNCHVSFHPEKRHCRHLQQRHHPKLTAAGAAFQPLRRAIECWWKTKKKVTGTSLNSYEYL